MLEEMLNERKLPPLLPREEMVELLQKEVYGYLPPLPETLEFEVQEDALNKNFCAGKAKCNRITAKCKIKGKEFSFPFMATTVNNGKKNPFFVLANFSGQVPDRYLPVEELIDNGFSVLSFHYEDVTTDKNEFTSGLAGVLFENGERKGSDPGKIAMWAWAAQRILDYAYTREDLFDLEYSVMCGHSRLGKTALFAVATDQRFRFCYSNDSGCMGAALSRGKVGESVNFICGKFHRWFCPSFLQYGEKEGDEWKMPFDQHYLLACVAPRPLLVGSASEDEWADPASEYLSCVAAAAAFGNDFCHPDRLPLVNDQFLEGKLGYQLRQGRHYLGREDWSRLIRFVNIHREKGE